MILSVSYLIAEKDYVPASFNILGYEKTQSSVTIIETMYIGG